MSSEEVSTTQLLGAYLNGDVTPSERTAVEKFLADDSSARLELDELRKLNVYLKSGDRQARAEALEKLRNAIGKFIRQNQLQAALTAGITGEATEQERKLVQEHLAANPAARNDIQKLEAFSAKLKQSGDRTASDSMSATLRERMSQSLRAAGRKADVPVVASAVAITSPRRKPTEAITHISTETARFATTRAVSERPSLRVFAARETPWKKRVLVMTGLAAAVALLAGIEALRRNWSANVPTEIVEGPKKNIELSPTVIVEPRKNNDTTQPVIQIPRVANQNTQPAVLPPVVDNQNTVPAQNVVGTPRDVKTPVPPDGVVVPNVIVDQNPKPVTPAPVNTQSPVQNKTVVNNAVNNGGNGNVNPVAPVDTPAVANQNTTQNPTTNPGLINGNGVAPTNTVAQNTNKTVSGGVPQNSVGSTPAVASNNNVNNNVNPGISAVTPTNPNPLQPTAVNPTTVAVGPATLTNMKGAGIAQITVDGVVSALKKDDTIPSDALIETNENSHIALSLSGGGRLYVNSNSKLTLSYSNKGVTVNLSAGEIYFNNVKSGDVTVVVGKLKVEQAEEANVLVAGQLRVSNIGPKRATLSGTKKPNEKIESNMQASVANDGSDVKKEAISGQTGYWRQDVILDGDGLKAFQPIARTKR